MPERAVVSDRLQRVRGCVSEVQHATRLCIGSAGRFALVIRNDRSLETAMSGDQIFEFRTQQKIAIAAGSLKTLAGHLEERSVRNERLFHHLAEARHQLALR